MQYARLVVVILSIAVLARVIDPGGETAQQVVTTGDGTPMILRYAPVTTASRPERNRTSPPTG